MKSATPEIKKLAIVGGGITKDRAPYSDPEWDIWSTASIARMLPRVTMVWEIHTDAHVKPDTKLDWDCPVMLQHERGDTKNGKAWTPWHLIEKWGPHFSGSMCYMLGEAVYLGYDVIETFGVDMMEAEYRGRMREDFIYIVGLFRGMGKCIEISPGTPMLWDSPAYEYEDMDAAKEHFKGVLAYQEVFYQEKLEKVIQARGELEYVRGCKDSLAQTLGFMGV
jgi:hypothetical protein